ncbi:MAG: LPS-assembly lipoprotein [Porticoccus sp.]
MLPIKRYTLIVDRKGMTMKKLIRLTIASLLMATIVTGCGWHLRGTGQVADNISSVHISGRGQQSEFYQMLARSFKSNDIEVLRSATEAQYSIVTLNYKSERRIATVSGGARASEHQLTESIDILILAHDGTQLLPRTTLNTSRHLDFNENEVQSKTEEADLLRKEMRYDLTSQIIRRLNAVSNRSASSSEIAMPEDATED